MIYKSSYTGAEIDAVIGKTVAERKAELGITGQFITYYKSIVYIESGANPYVNPPLIDLLEQTITTSKQSEGNYTLSFSDLTGIDVSDWNVVRVYDSGNDTYGNVSYLVSENDVIINIKNDNATDKTVSEMSFMLVLGKYE